MLSEVVLEFQRYLHLSFTTVTAVNFETLVNLVVYVISSSQFGQKFMVYDLTWSFLLLEGWKVHLSSAVFNILFVLS